jgi:hypothetical protein
MSQQNTSLTKTFLVSGSTVTAYRAVKFTGTAVTLFDTDTAFPIGIAQATADPSTTVEVMLLGTTKAIVAEAVSPGSILVVATNSTLAVKTATAYTATSGLKTFGVALESGTTLAVVEVFINRVLGVQA